MDAPTGPLWSQQQAIAYEVALEAINDVAGIGVTTRKWTYLPKPVNVTSTHEFLIASGFTRFPEPCIGRFCRS
jgi:hypothetical protein